jgi:hypothetical protein
MRAALQGKTDLLSKQISLIVDSWLKWAGPNQTRGIVGKKELEEMGEEGDDPVGRFQDLLRAARES